MHEPASKPTNAHEKKNEKLSINIFRNGDPYNRDGVHFQTIYARTKYYEFSFFPRTVDDWNELPSDTFSAQNLAVFKQNIATIIHVMPWDH